jgi:multiple sugar transport system permease protein
MTIRTATRAISLQQYAVWLILAILIIVSLFPIWWVIRTGLSSREGIFRDTSSLLPVDFTLQHFQRVLGMFSAEEAVAQGGTPSKFDFWLYLRNSLIVSTSLVAGQTLFSAMAAYAFARLRFAFREQLFFIYLTAMMVPGVITLIPNFVLMRELGWINTFQGIIAPGLLMTPFAVFFLRQFFLGINHELEEAAMLDGASIPTIFWRVILPLSIPALSTLAILQFIGSWNDYLWPFLMSMQEDSVRILTIGLAKFRSQTPQGAPDWGGLMASTTLSLIPTVVIFLVFGRKAVNAIQFTGFR